MARADKSWRLVPLCLLVTAALCSCSAPSRKPIARLGHRSPGDPSAIYLVRAQPPPPPPPLSPFADAPVSFLVHGNFARGEQVLVRVCLHPDHSIASSDVLESSGDPRFDQRALDWARLVQLRAASVPGRTFARCGPVRVELRDTAAPGTPGIGHQVGEGLG